MSRAGAGPTTGGTAARGRAGVPALTARWRVAIDAYPADAAWSRDGALVAVACAEGDVLVLDAASGAVRHVLAAHSAALGVAWSAAVAGHPAGPLPHGVLASAGQDGRVRLWDPERGALLADLDAAGADDRPTAAGAPAERRKVAWAEHLAWSPAGDRLATAAGREVRLWDAAGRLVRRHPAMESTVGALAWRPRSGDVDGARLTAAGYGGAVVYAPERGYARHPEVAVEDAEGRAVVERRFAWKGSFLALAWAPDGRTLTAGMQENAIHIWAALRAAEVARRTAAGQAPLPAPRAAGLPPSDEEAGFDNLEMSGFPLKVRELAWSADGQHLASGGGADVTVWSFAGKGPAGTRPLQLTGHALPVTDLAFLPRGAVLASGGADGQLFVWDFVRSTRRPVGTAFIPGAVSRVAWQPGGAGGSARRVLAAHAAGAVTLWDVPW